MAKRSIKVLLVGDGAVGKTSLCSVFVHHSFPREYVPSVLDQIFTNINIDGKTYVLNIWDTAGQEDFDRLRVLSYPNTDVFVVCYAVNCQNSFTNLTAKWIPELTRHYPNAPFILVGTKVDMRHASESEGVFISYQNGCRIAKQIGASYFVECSALNGTNVIEVFTRAAETALGLRKKLCVIL